MNFTILCYCLWISPCCAIVCEFHHFVQLFVNFTMLCNCWWISPCCAIVGEFHHVVQLFVNFTMLCSWLCSSVFEVLIGCWGNVGVLLTIIVLNEEYFLTMILSDWLTNRTISRVATATKNTGCEIECRLYYQWLEGTCLF